MKTEINFIKMTGLGNDYIYLDNLDKEFEDIDFSSLSISVSNRHFGVGSDGLVVISEDSNADCYMRIFNADGSEASMCGNALRCVAYLMNQKTNKQEITINTLSGVRKSLVKEDSNIEVFMGEPKIVSEYTIEGYKCSLVNVGNEHLIFPNCDLNNDKFVELAKRVQNNILFPDGINVEKIDIIDNQTVRCFVYERGSGVTLACGSGATAVYYYCLKNKLISESAQVKLQGGALNFRYTKGVYMMGSVDLICEGKYYWRRNG